MRKIIFIALVLLFLGLGGYFGAKLIRGKITHKLIDPAQNFFEKAADDPIVASVSGITVIFPKVKDHSELLKTLQTILNGTTMGMKIKTVDLRFEKPVVSYGP
jgi:hypothetical protein